MAMKYDKTWNYYKNELRLAGVAKGGVEEGFPLILMPCRLK
jgi:hypothetical protein